MSHVHAFPMHIYSIFNILTIFEMCWDFSDCLSLSLFFLFMLVVSMAPKLKSNPSRNPLRSEHHLLLILLPLLFGFMIRMLERTSRRTFLDKVFIQNAESFWQTSPTLTFPMSFIVGVGSHCVTSQSLVLSY